MQAGVVSQRLNFWDGFTCREPLFLTLLVWMLFQREKLIRSAG